MDFGDLGFGFVMFKIKVYGLRFTLEGVRFRADDVYG